MKQINVVSFTSMLISFAMIFVACSSTETGRSTEDEFFEPVGKVTHKTPGSGSASTITRDQTGSKERGTVSEEIIVMLKEQTKQMNNVIQELNSLTKREFADTLNNIKHLNDTFMNRDNVSNEMLSEMVREQNVRLNSVIEQLKLLAQYQLNNQNLHNMDLAGMRARTFYSPKMYDASLGYGKAIQFYQQKKYKSAIQSFRSLLKKGVDLELRDNCRFWMGVCYFQLKNINQAMAQFMSVLEIPGSDKIEGAYFMMGQCYEQIGEKKYAKAAFEKMMKKYPMGSLKQMAQIKLALLK